MLALKRCVAIYPPMLDLFANIDKQFLDKHRVEINAIVSYCEEKHHGIQEYVADTMQNSPDDFTFRAGGATFNTQKILSEWMECYFFGIVGHDSYGSIIEEKMKGTRVKIYLDKSSVFSTPWAYVFITEDQRTIVAKQDKNVRYSETAKQRIHALIDSQTVFYFVSFMFFLENIVEECMAMYKNKNSLGFCSIVNLSSEEIVSTFKEKIMEIIRVSDFVIGNKAEYYALSGTQDEESLLSWIDSLDIAYAITDGPGEVIGRIPGGPLRRVTPACVPGNCNTNGAGDSFAAGFIGSLSGKAHKEVRDILPLLEKGIEASYIHIKSLEKS
ncbi:adenosine kinase [Nematocida minor]|uniref:adenosine kinase n=1 Tax=Nematocida minor TaxID=1912983 RepID=UPI0022200ECA|nr:adenosine kinase [Nematocida minor]KAI5188966.1 adenosine kinase [Nematocida minor]